jgi:hypothetical protein
MSKLKKVAFAAALALAILAAFHQTKLAHDARDEARILREQQAQSAKQISSLQDSFADKDSRLEELLEENSRLRNNPNETELLKLRGEVTRLRPLQEDVVALQKMLQQSSTGLPAWKTNELANVGRANPLDALQTYLYSAQTTNKAEIQKSFVGDDTDPPPPEVLQKYIGNENNNSFGPDVTDFRILSENWLTSDRVQVELSVRSAKASGVGMSIPLTFKNVNGEWKLVLFNIRNVDGQVTDVNVVKDFQ